MQAHPKQDAGLLDAAQDVLNFDRAGTRRFTGTAFDL